VHVVDEARAAQWVNSRVGRALAIDVGATKIAASLVDGDGARHDRHDAKTPGRDNQDPEAVWLVIDELMQKVLSDSGDLSVAGVGIASAGPINVDRGTVSPINIPAWREFPLLDRVAGAIAARTGAGDIPVRLAGDGVCAAAGEHWRGAGRGESTVVTLVVSSGVGAGLVIGDRLVAGTTGNAGHVGHVVVNIDDGAPVCPCGSTGCVEAYASGPSMVAWAKENGWRPDDAVTAADLAGDAARGLLVPGQAYQRAARALAAGIASVAATVDLRLAVIGGGVAQSADVLLGPLRSFLKRYARLAFIDTLDVAPADLGTAAGLVGAAALVLDPQRYDVPGVARRN
jgi:glucokinase